MHSQWESLVHLAHDMAARTSMHSQRVSLLHFPQPMGTSFEKGSGDCRLSWVPDALIRV